MFNHILVPVDFTDKNEAAIAAARQLAQQNDARITLLHVIEFIDYPDDEEISSFYEKLQHRSDRELDNLVRAFAQDDLDVAVDTIINKRPRGIVEFAYQNNVDLIVMSSHLVEPGKSGEGWGTISYQVSAVCHCSIMLLKQPNE